MLYCLFLVSFAAAVLPVSIDSNKRWVVNEPGHSLIIKKSHFYDCSTSDPDSQGGAIYLYDSTKTFEVDQTYFYRCLAHVSGGGFYADVKGTVLTRTCFYACACSMNANSIGHGSGCLMNLATKVEMVSGSYTGVSKVLDNSVIRSGLGGSASNINTSYVRFTYTAGPLFYYTSDDHTRILYIASYHINSGKALGFSNFITTRLLVENSNFVNVTDNTGLIFSYYTNKVQFKYLNAIQTTRNLIHIHVGQCDAIFTSCFLPSNYLYTSNATVLVESPRSSPVSNIIHTYEVGACEFARPTFRVSSQVFTTNPHSQNILVLMAHLVFLSLA